MSEIRRNGRERTTEALDEYLRALGRSARDQAVADAEQIVCRAWSDELARVQRVMDGALSAAKTAAQSAQTLVREHQRNGDLSGLLEAQRQLEQARQQERRSAEAGQVLLAAVAEEQELLALAAEERETVALANRIWISFASHAVYSAGTEDGSGPGSGAAGQDNAR